MLYYLFRYLEETGVPGSGLWSYISFRSLMAFMIAIVFSWYFGKRFIEFMHNNREKYEEKNLMPLLTLLLQSTNIPHLWVA